LLPQLAGQCSSLLISMSTQSRVLAQTSMNLMLESQTVRNQDIGRITVWLQEVCTYVLAHAPLLVPI
jgi:hypothetical protein